MATEKLIVQLESDTAKLRADLDKVDDKLNKVDGSTKKADKGFANFSETASKAASTVAMVGAAAVAAATALAGAAIVAANYAREIKIAAQLSGLAVEKIQLISHATATVGIGMEQLGDISKDTLEKIGDYLNTGGGGFMDYVDAMKLTERQAIETANEFKHMSGPAVLQEMVKRMEAANISSVQMSHALEGMASDTTKLIPLLADGGKKMSDLVEAASALTIPLTASDIQKFEDLKISTDNAAGALKSLGEQTLLQLSDMFIRTAENASKFIAMLNKGTEEYNLKRLEEIREELNEIGHTAENAQTPLGRFWNVLSFNTHQEQFAGERVNELLKERAALYEANAKIQEQANSILTPIDESQSSIVSNVVTPKVTEDKSAAELDALKDRFKSEEELLTAKYEKEMELARGNKELMMELENEYIEKLIELDENTDLTRQEAERDRYFDNFESLGQEKFDAEIAEQQRLLEEKLINEEEYLKAVYALGNKYGKLETKEAKKKSEDKEGFDSDYANAALQIGESLFEGNKAIEAGLVVAKTGAAVMHQLGSGDPYTAFERAAAAGTVGAVQLAQTLGASKGGGSITTPSGTSAPQENNNRFSSSVEVNESVVGGGSTSNNVNFTADDADGIGGAIANWLNDKLSDGSVKLGG